MHKLITIALPETTPPGESCFFVEPEQVSQWLAELPLANIGELTHRIFEALKEANRLDIPPRARFDFLERLLEPLQIILPALEGHFGYQPFPLTDKLQKVAHLSARLQAEMIIGYRHVLAAGDTGAWLQRHAVGKLAPTCTHRIWHFVHGMFCNFGMVYESTPAGLWALAHRLFQQAVERHQLRKRIVSCYTANRATTLEQEYNRLLLMSLLPVHRLRREERQALLAGLSEWSSRMRLVRADSQLIDAGYYLQVPSDDAPFAVAGETVSLSTDSARLYRLDTEVLVRHLKGLCSSGSPIDWLDNGVEVSRELVNKLLTFWGEPRVRHGKRMPERGALELVVGVNALHKLPVSPGMHERSRGDEIEFDTALQKKAWVDTYASQQNSHSISGQLIDRSETGYGLSLPVLAVEHVFAGELVFVRRGAMETWRIGSVQWIKDVDETTLNMGLQLLAHDAFPVIVKIKGEIGTSDALECVVAISEDMDPVIFLPYLPRIAEKSLLLENRGKVSVLGLQEKISESPAYLAFTFMLDDNAPQIFGVDREHGVIWPHL